MNDKRLVTWSEPWNWDGQEDDKITFCATAEAVVRNIRRFGLGYGDKTDQEALDEFMTIHSAKFLENIK